MIEHRIKGPSSARHKWHPTFMPIDEMRMILLEYRICGIVYTERTPAFLEAVSKEKMWEYLQH